MEHSHGPTCWDALTGLDYLLLAKDTSHADMLQPRSGRGDLTSDLRWHFERLHGDAYFRAVFCGERLVEPFHELGAGERRLTSLGI